MRALDVTESLPEPLQGLSGAEDEPPGKLPNGCWPCIGCGHIVGKGRRYVNWCSDCSDELDNLV